MALIQAQYPELTPILQQPGVWDAISTAVQNHYTPARLQAALQATEYYRNTNAADRAWFILGSIDPKTAKQRYDTYKQKIDDFHVQLGVNLPADVGESMVQQAAANQWTDAEFRLHIMTAAQATPGAPESGNPTSWFAGSPTPATGEWAANANIVSSLAGDYGVPLSQDGITDWAKKLTAGEIDQNAVRGYMIAQAKSMYPNDPNLDKALDQGQTTAQYADPYKQVAVRELNMNPGDFNLLDTKWSSALGAVNATGDKVPLSLDQWQAKVRTDPQYNYDMTTNAKNQAATFITGLKQQMGMGS